MDSNAHKPPKRPLTHSPITTGQTSSGRCSTQQDASHEPQATEPPREPDGIWFQSVEIRENF
jgi:hypothetical protein